MNKYEVYIDFAPSWDELNVEMHRVIIDAPDHDQAKTQVEENIQSGLYSELIPEGYVWYVWSVISMDQVLEESE